MSDAFQKRPNRLPLPPMMLLACLVASWLLTRLLPIGWEASEVSDFMRGTGWFLIGGAITLDIWTFRTLASHNTTVLPHKAAAQLATDGPFRYSRNPIYFANILIMVGLGFALGSRWFLIGGAVLFFLLNEFAVKREEKHLAANFPEEWDAYSKRVRRWA